MVLLADLVCLDRKSGGILLTIGNRRCYLFTVQWWISYQIFDSYYPWIRFIPFSREIGKSCGFDVRCLAVRRESYLTNSLSFAFQLDGLT